MGYLWEYPKIECPENCRYRNKQAPFCGYCLPEIMRELGIRKEKEKTDHSTEEQTGHMKTEDFEDDQRGRL